MSNRFLSNTTPLARPRSNFNGRSQLKAAFLIEFMLASMLGLMLLVLLGQLYISLKKIYLQQHALQIVENNAHFASFYLRKKIAMAGYLNCEASSFPVTQTPLIQGYTKQTAPAFLAKNSLIDNSDIIEIKQCATINNNSRPALILFYIANTHRIDSHGKNISALYEKIHLLTKKNTNKTVELVPDIARMETSYGIANEAGDIDTYQSTRYLTSWKNVNAVRITLWLNTETSPSPYVWNLYIHLKEKVLS